ncbi:MAG: helix-turn-helix domain-containing protein [Armatimonadota bacterium]
MALLLQDQDMDRLRSLADSTDKVTARRAKILLLTADGRDATDISKTLGVSERTIRYVMRKFNISGAASIERRSPPGRRPMISAPQRTAVVELISRAPQDFGTTKDEWTLPDLIDVVVRESIIQNVSLHTIRRKIRRCLEEHPGLCERVRFRAQDRPGAPASNQNAVKHGAYSDLELSADEESRVAELTKRLLDDFPQKDEVGMKLVQTITEYFIRIERTNDKIGADAMKRLNGKLQRALKKLKTRGLGGSPSEREITPAEWASDLLERYRKWEARQKNKL